MSSSENINILVSILEEFSAKVLLIWYANTNNSAMLFHLQDYLLNVLVKPLSMDNAALNGFIL